DNSSGRELWKMTPVEEEEDDDDPPSSVKAFTPSAHLQVYPNPVIDRLYVQADDRIEGIRLLSLNGRILQLWQGVNTIDLSGCPSGVYLLQVQTASGSVLRKIVK